MYICIQIISLICVHACLHASLFVCIYVCIQVSTCYIQRKRLTYMYI